MVRVLRFVVLGLCLVGIGVCIHALARLAGWVPPGPLPLYPSWTAVHFVAAGAFAVIAPLQMWPALRGRSPGLHKGLGRVGVAMGAVMATSGLAIAYLAPERPVSERIFMSSFFLGYAATLGLGFRAALRRDFAAHRGWMIRMVATALTPITQRLIFPLFALTIGISGREVFWQLFISAAWIGWGVNIALAEAWLRPRRQAPSPQAAS